MREFTKAGQPLTLHPQPMSAVEGGRQSPGMHCILAQRLFVSHKGIGTPVLLEANVSNLQQASHIVWIMRGALGKHRDRAFQIARPSSGIGDRDSRLPVRSLLIAPLR